MTRSLACLLLLHFLLVSCSSGAKVVTIDVQAAKNLIQTDHAYLDVRTVEEFVKGHVDTAMIINIPYMVDTSKGRVKNPDFLKEVSSAFNKEDHVVVGCQSGVRSLYATSDLLADVRHDPIDLSSSHLGFETLMNKEHNPGLIQGWSQASYMSPNDLYMLF